MLRSSRGGAEAGTRARLSHRAERLGAQFRRELTALLAGPLKDPRLDGARVTAVRAPADLSLATVYVQCERGDVLEAIDGFESAMPYVRRVLGRAMRLRKIPEFRFVPDRTQEHASRIEELLREARASDAARRGDRSDSAEGGSDSA